MRLFYEQYDYRILSYTTRRTNYVLASKYSWKIDIKKNFKVIKTHHLIEAEDDI